jgi:hypothetical protein
MAWVRINPKYSVKAVPSLKHNASCHSLQLKSAPVLKARVVLRERRGVSQKRQVKETFTTERANEGVELYLYLCCKLGARLGWVVDATPRPLYPAGKESRCALYRRHVWSQGRSGPLRKTSPHWYSIPRPSSPYCSRYTDYAIPAHRPAMYLGYQLLEPTFSMFRIYPVRRTWPLFIVSLLSG